MSRQTSSIYALISERVQCVLAKIPFPSWKPFADRWALYCERKLLPFESFVDGFYATGAVIRIRVSRWNNTAWNSFGVSMLLDDFEKYRRNSRRIGAGQRFISFVNFLRRLYDIVYKSCAMKKGRNSGKKSVAIPESLPGSLRACLISRAASGRLARIARLDSSNALHTNTLWDALRAGDLWNRMKLQSEEKGKSRRRPK